MIPPLTVTVQTADRVAYYELDGELEERTSAVFLDAMGWLRTGVVDMVVVDCRKLAFVDARGLTALLHARESAAAAGAGLVLANPSTLLARILTATALTERLPIADPALLAAVEGSSSRSAG